jgi:NAD(P)-dependent dehydrogenase (short-subunit alcohol dehydrogenase family)
VTGTGGDFGNAGSREIPSYGGLAAAMKTLAVEWPEVTCKSIDLDAGDPAETLARSLCDELVAGDGTVQLGLRGERRLRPTIVPCPDPDRGEPGPVPDSDWVFLITGGARGVTAELALHLGRRFRPTLVLVGRSPEPPGAEDPTTAGVEGLAELKAAIATELESDGRTPAPAEVEDRYVRLQREREIRRNLDELRATGAKVEYVQLDVRDDDALGALVDGLYDRHGRIDGVIHGAGVIEDKLVRDKTPASFERVLHTKTDAAFVLSRKLRPETVRLFVLMSSVTAVHGNRGQFDYAAANGALNSLAARLNREWPGRVTALNWGPWEGGGMVSAEVRDQFRRRGVQLIPVDRAVEAFEREAWSHESRDPVVVLGDGPWFEAGPPDSGPAVRS